jgi:organic hydroperoxide reductase OsmC/OhrA
MNSMLVSLRNVPGTKAAMGWAGGHTVVIDRAEGRAGGMGLGFNGGQMIALAIGGCFCNDLRYVADAMGVELDTIEVEVAIELDGKPLLVTSATMTVHATAAQGVDVAEIIRRAEADSTVSTSVRAGFPVKVLAA